MHKDEPRGGGAPPLPDRSAGGRLQFAGCEVEIGGYKAVSDNEGQVSLFIPLDEQKTSYTVSAAIPLLDNTIYTPCGENDVLLTE